MQMPHRERKRKRRSPPCGSFYLVVREDPRLRTGAPVVPEFKIIEDGVLQIIGRPLFSLACIGLCRPAKAGRGVLSGSRGQRQECAHDQEWGYFLLALDCPKLLKDWLLRKKLEPDCIL